MKWGILVAMLLLTATASAQQAYGGGVKRVNPKRNVAPVPQLNCDKIVPSWQPWQLEYCRAVDFSMQDGFAHAWGRPRPSPTVLSIPALGTDEARKAGVSCSEGRVIAKVGDAWVQALDSERRYLRCRPSVELPQITIGR